jgi:hypothetical protein
VDSCHRAEGDVKYGVAGHDAIVVRREALRHEECFASALGASLEIRELRRSLIACKRQRFSYLSDLVVRVVGEIDPRLRVHAERRGAASIRIVVDAVVVAGVRSDGCVSHCENARRIYQRAVGAAPSAHVEPAVPIGGQAQAKLDGVLLAIGAGSLVDGSIDLAVLREAGSSRIQDSGFYHGLCDR